MCVQARGDHMWVCTWKWGLEVDVRCLSQLLSAISLLGQTLSKPWAHQLAKLTGQQAPENTSVFTKSSFLHKWQELIGTQTMMLVWQALSRLNSLISLSPLLYLLFPYIYLCLCIRELFDIRELFVVFGLAELKWTLHRIMYQMLISS